MFQCSLFQSTRSKCDNKDTLVINSIYTEFLFPKKCLLIEGDQDMYNHLQLKYGNDLTLILPAFFEKVLLKIYLDAKASGYQSYAVASNFKQTHYFLVATWISILQHFVALFLKQHTS